MTSNEKDRLTGIAQSIETIVADIRKRGARQAVRDQLLQRAQELRRLADESH